MGERRIVVITGLSGAGQSTSLKILEDLGYEAVDNLPLFLLPALLTQDELRERPVAVRIDLRTRDFSVERLLAELRSQRARTGVSAKMLFMISDDEVLMRRFTETRRRHPLAIDRPVIDGIERERQMLGPVIEASDLVIDTSDLTIHDLKRCLSANFSLATTPELQVTVVSFSYRSGLPRAADLVFDVRFLRNPHYEPDLKPLTGLDLGVADYVAADPDYPAFFDRMTGFVVPLLPRFRAEGKSYLTIAIGCTGGQHRSVFVADQPGESVGAARNPRHYRASRLQARPQPGGRKMIGIVLGYARAPGRRVHRGGRARGRQAGADGGQSPSVPMTTWRPSGRRYWPPLKQVEKDAGVIVMTDMFGGTPSNLAISIMAHAEVEVISGVNLPMLIKLASIRATEPIKDAATQAQEAGRKYITIA